MRSKYALFLAVLKLGRRRFPTQTIRDEFVAIQVPEVEVKATKKKTDLK